MHYSFYSHATGLIPYRRERKNSRGSELSTLRNWIYLDQHSKSLHSEEFVEKSTLSLDNKSF